MSEIDLMQMEKRQRQIASRDKTIAELGASNASLIRRVAGLENQLAEAQRQLGQCMAEYKQLVDEWKELPEMRTKLAEANGRAERAEREWQVADHRMVGMLKVVEAAQALRASADISSGATSVGARNRLWAQLDAYDAAGKGETDDQLSAPEIGTVTQSDLDTIAYIGSGGFKSKDVSVRLDDEDESQAWDRARLEAEFAEMTAYVQTINGRIIKAIGILDDSWVGRERPDPLVRSLYAVLEPDSWLGRDDAHSRAGQAGGEVA